MQSRALRIVVLAWLGWWFGIMVPGHERGQVVIPGMQPVDSCCAPAPGSEEDAAAKSGAASCHTDAGDPPHSPVKKGDPVARCAVCFITARLQAPVDIAFDPPSFTLLTVLPVLDVQSLDGIAIRIPAAARGPPDSPFPIT